MTADRRPAPRPGPPAGPDGGAADAGDFGAFIRREGGAGRLVVQPRMGFDDPGRMRAGLAATKAARAVTVGTVTLDSYTRLGKSEALADALAEGRELNGYPITAHPPAVTARMLAGIRDRTFPVQVRHGSAVPQHIFATLIDQRLDASEGGPVSYCLPYGRTPLADSVRNWAEGVRRFAALRELGREPHLESFGGCLLGQLCPPSLLVAVSVLEALFFHRHGVRDVSVSYAQQTDPAQDREAVAALRRLCTELLPTPTWHVVVYAYMGLYPVTEHGAYGLLSDAAELAVHSGAERLIVKTVAESRRIPTIEENVAALEAAARSAHGAAEGAAPPTRQEAAAADSETYEEAAALVEAVLDLHPDPGVALAKAFERGYLDVPWCLHPDNRGRTRSYIDGDGRLRWAHTGALPLGRSASRRAPLRRIGSADLLADLHHVQRRYDAAGGRLPAAAGGAPRPREITGDGNSPRVSHN
ncbi:methylaspartate mutase [Streptomyces sp. enrichment culture]|uniref:methylaspartate mutase n=1 Tax=Streptomyces sp. enrichment culture TaxID=1795815 RepID=UPI003F579C06